MNFAEYQSKSKETAIYPKMEPSWIYPALGLTGEAGEIMEKIKKTLRGNISEEDKKQKIASLKHEIGDVLWYLTQMATELGFSMQEIAEENIERLKSRQERGVIHGDGDNR